MSSPTRERAPSVAALRGDLNLQAIGLETYDRIAALYPICRSITGDGVRATLARIGQDIDLQTTEIPTGTPVFDWVVPQEWNIRDAYVKDSRGRRVIDYNESNLHVLSYSLPVHQTMSLGELRPYLFSMPDRPDWIPYKTSYYHPRWGFCLSDRRLQELADENYEVCIDSSLEDGHMTIAECVVPGQHADEVLVSCHVCHPSLCNDNLSGVSLATTLAKLLGGASLRYSYRFLFVPGTIGAIAWLALNEQRLARIKHGLVLSCVGDPGRFTYKRSRRGTADIDRAFARVLACSGRDHDVIDFSPYGYDERQYCSPGINLPVGSFSRTPYAQFPEYHTSADNLDLVQPAALADSLRTCLAAIEILEGNGYYVNQNPKCEPQLGRRGLYSSLGGLRDPRAFEAALLWVLNMSDGDHSLLDIAERSGTSFDTIREAATALAGHDLLAEKTG